MVHAAQSQFEVAGSEQDLRVLEIWKRPMSEEENKRAEISAIIERVAPRIKRFDRPIRITISKRFRTSPEIT
jgi:hypothetical protein